MAKDMPFCRLGFALSHNESASHFKNCKGAKLEACCSDLPNSKTVLRVADLAESQEGEIIASDVLNYQKESQEAEEMFTGPLAVLNKISSLVKPTSEIVNKAGRRNALKCLKLF